MNHHGRHHGRRLAGRQAGLAGVVPESLHTAPQMRERERGRGREREREGGGEAEAESEGEGGREREREASWAFEISRTPPPIDTSLLTKHNSQCFLNNPQPGNQTHSNI